MTKVNLIGVPRRSWSDKCSTSKIIRGANMVSKDREELLQAYIYILKKI